MNAKTLVSDLRKKFGEKRVLADEPMSAHTTFSVGGPADAFFSPKSAAEVEQALDITREANAPWSVLGCGSNVLVADTGVRGLVIHFGDEFSHMEFTETCIKAQCGATNKAVASYACMTGLSGYEFACGIPGSIGGAAFMNAGAYDGEFADVCKSVTCLTAAGDIIEVDGQDADWGYRRSAMMENGWIVLDATLQLIPFEGEYISRKMGEFDRRRADKQPLEFGSAGSTFKRPIGHYAAKLIEDAGMSGHAVGGAKVSEKHCGFVINVGHATAADILSVINDVKNAVFADSGVVLEPEVRMWGFDD